MADLSDKNQQQLKDQLLSSLFKDRRRERFWRNTRFLISVMLILFFSWRMFLPESWVAKLSGYPKVANLSTVSLVRLSGLIAPNEIFSAAEAIPILEEAFRSRSAKGVVVVINSGGGTPVQADLIHDAILHFKQQYHKKVIVIGEDMLASGAYFVAVAADKIYVNRSTLTGSIGVIVKGFGFSPVLKKLGVERRVYAVGKYKNSLDMFLPENPSDIKRMETVLHEVHQHFIDAVIAGRQGKLKASGSVLFTGDFWTGETALRLGLVDGVGDLTSVVETEFPQCEIKHYGDENSFLKAFINRIGTTLSIPHMIGSAHVRAEALVD
jgi:protease-4